MSIIKANKLHKDIKIKSCPFCGESDDIVLEEYCSQGYSPDEAYVQKVLPEKMKYNLEYIRNFGIISDFKVMIDTVIKVIK